MVNNYLFRTRALKKKKFMLDHKILIISHLAQHNFIICTSVKRFLRYTTAYL